MLNATFSVIFNTVIGKNWNNFFFLKIFQVLSDQSKFEQVDALYEEAEKVDPENANLLVHRGLIQLQWKGDIVKAIEFITQ